MSLVFKKQRVAHQIILDRGVTDILKLICCTIIGLTHYSQYILQNGLSNNIIYKALSIQGGYIGVAFFFFFSGYGLMKSWQMKSMNLLEFIKKRLAKVYFPAVIISIIWVVVLSLIPDLQSFDFGLKGMIMRENLYMYIGNTFLLDFCDGVLWFIKAILMLYVIFYIYVMIRDLLNIKYLTLVVALLGTFLVYELVYHLIAPFAAVSIPLFTIGVLLADYAEVVAKRRVIFTLISVVILSVLLMLFRNDNLWLHALSNYYMIVIVVLISTVIEVRIEKTPSWISGLSFDVYLTHNKVKYLMAWILPTMPFIIFIVFSIIAATVSFGMRKLFRI
ncbi:MAG: acyltransferase family protein [Mangrovibacterium sp.]